MHPSPQRAGRYAPRRRDRRTPRAGGPARSCHSASREPLHSSRSTWPPARSHGHRTSTGWLAPCRDLLTGTGPCPAPPHHLADGAAALFTWRRSTIATVTLGRVQRLCQALANGRTSACRGAVLNFRSLALDSATREGPPGRNFGFMVHTQCRNGREYGYVVLRKVASLLAERPMCTETPI